MTARSINPNLLAALGAALALPLGAASAILASDVGAEYALAILGAVMIAALLVTRPWAAVPVVVIVGALADQLLGLTEVAQVAGVRIALIAVAVAGLAIRRASVEDWGPRIRTSADPIAIGIFAISIVGAAIGLAAGNERHDIWVAGYLISVVPAYFFLVTFTLNTRERLLSAAKLFAAGALVLAIIAYTGEGRQGGLISTIALAGCMALATRDVAPTAERLIAGFLALLFAADVGLSGFRTVWIASLVGLGLMIIWMGPARGRVIAGLLALLAAGLLIIPSVGGPVGERFEVAAAQFGESSGYREAETTAGLEIFERSPIVGHGLGAVDRDVYLETLGYADVGPSFHAYYLTVATNVGLVGLLALFGLLAAGISAGRRVRLDQPSGALAVGFATLAGGWAVGAIFAGPTDGHWELGLLAGLAITAAAHARETAPQRQF